MMDSCWEGGLVVSRVEGEGLGEYQAVAGATNTSTITVTKTLAVCCVGLTLRNASEPTDWP